MPRQDHYYGENHLHYLTANIYRRARIFHSDRFKLKITQTLGDLRAELGFSLYLALGLFFEGQPPELYLVPSRVWEMPNGVFVSRDYEGLKSKPEWGLNVSQRNTAVLDPYRFETMMEQLCGGAVNKPAGAGAER